MRYINPRLYFTFTFFKQFQIHELVLNTDFSILKQVEHTVNCGADGQRV